MKMAAMQHSLQVARKSLWLPCAASNIPHACMIYSRCSSLPSGARSVTARIVFSDFCSCHPFAIFNADCFFLPVVFFLRIFEILVPCLIHILCMKDHLQFTKRTHHFNCGSINYAMDFFCSQAILKIYVSIAVLQFPVLKVYGNICSSFSTNVLLELGGCNPEPGDYDPQPGDCFRCAFQ